jgi:hypothetical protein
MRRFLLMLTFLSCTGWSQPAPQQVQPPIVVQVQTPTPKRGFLDYVQELGPLIAASVAIGLGAVQWAIQREQLDHTLFDKRYKVYVAVDTYLTSAINSKIYPNLGIFELDTAHAEFLFANDVTEFIKQIREHSIELAVVNRQIREHLTAHHDFQTGATDTFDMPPGELQRLKSKEAALLAWFVNAKGTRRNELFRPYLQLGRELPWYVRLERDLNALTERLDGMLKRLKQNA